MRGCLFCLLIVALFTQHGYGSENSEKKNRFNVLFIAIDDLRPELGCYGIEQAQSPHLDQFAETGVTFDRHYVQVATCGASRYALLTGRSPANSKALGNSAAYSGSTKLNAEEQAGAQTMPELFRRSGYHTTLIGKISHTADGLVYAYNGSGDGRLELPHAWSELATPLGSWKRGWGIFFAYPNGIHREDGGGHKDLMNFEVQNDDDLPDGQMATIAIETLRNYGESQKPFFMGLGFFKPHLPFVAPQQDWDAFNDVEIDIPDDEKIDSPYWHKSGEFFKYDTPYEKTNPLRPAAHRMAKRAYYACVRYVDRQVGRVLAALDEAGLSENTIVIIWGDHGWGLGEQQLWAKHTPFELANRSVLMMRVPGVSQTGLRTSALAETIDLYPTLVDLCQPKFQTTHWSLDGLSLQPVLSGEKKQVRNTATSYWRDAKSIRTVTHRLILGKQKKQSHTELYDLRESLSSAENIAEMNSQLVSEIQLMPAKDVE